MKQLSFLGWPPGQCRMKLRFMHGTLGCMANQDVATVLGWPPGQCRMKQRDGMELRSMARTWMTNLKMHGQDHAFKLATIYALPLRRVPGYEIRTKYTLPTGSSLVPVLQTPHSVPRPPVPLSSYPPVPLPPAPLTHCPLSACTSLPPRVAPKISPLYRPHSLHNI